MFATDALIGAEMYYHPIIAGLGSFFTYIVSSTDQVFAWLGTPAARAPIWVPLAAFLVPALITLLGAVMNRRTSQQVAREKATLDLIEKSESSQYYIENSKVFSALRLGVGFDHLHPISGQNDDQRRAVLNHLNHYELVGLGIRKKLLDSDTYEGWMGTSLVRDWKAAQDFIWRERCKRDRKDVRWEYHATAFEHFEAIACRWGGLVPLAAQRRPLPSNAAAGLGDEPLPELVGSGTVMPMENA